MRVGWSQRALWATAMVSAAAAASGQPRPADLRALLQEGQVAYQEQRYRRAQELFSQVFEATGNPELLYNLALCHRAMGEPAEAARYLRRFLVARPQHPERASMERTLAELEASAQVIAQPGPTATAQPGVTGTPPPRLERDTGLDGPPAARPLPPGPTAPRPSPWLRWTLLGAGVVGVGAGAGMILSARGRVSDAASAANDSDYLEALDAASTLRGAGVVVMSVGVVALGAGIVHWVTSRPAAERPLGHPPVAVGIGPGSVMLSGRW